MAGGKVYDLYQPHLNLLSGFYIYIYIYKRWPLIDLMYSLELSLDLRFLTPWDSLILLL